MLAGISISSVVKCKATRGRESVMAREHWSVTAVFFNRLGEICNRSFEQHWCRTSRLNLVTAAAVLWTTIYLHRIIQILQNGDATLDPELLQHLPRTAGNTSTAPATTPGATPPSPSTTAPCANLIRAGF